MSITMEGRLMPKILDEDFIKLCTPPKGSGMSDGEIGAILECCEAALSGKKGGFIVELGTHNGGTAKAIRRFVDKYFEDVRLLCNDIFTEDGVPAIMTALNWTTSHWKDVEAGKTAILVGDSQIWNSDYEREIDVLVVDACHCYDCTKNNFLIREDKIVPGGFACFHDTAEYIQGRNNSGLGHDGTSFQTLKALEDMGFLSGERPGWEKFEPKRLKIRDDVPGIMCFRKIK